jgi:very-short-patch-repair endonuclease
LEGLGFKVIRFRDEEVLEDLDGVVSRIGETIREIERVGGVVIPLKDRRRK